MKTIRCLIIFSASICVGCVSKKTAQTQSQASFIAGQQQATQPAMVVLVQGEVRRNVIPWHEGMTLAEAVTAADYRGLRDPKTIVLTRQGEIATVNVRQLLQGRDNPELRPGDVIDLRR
jgi:hypothetical protein